MVAAEWMTPAMVAGAAGIAAASVGAQRRRQHSWTLLATSGSSASARWHRGWIAVISVGTLLAMLAATYPALAATLLLVGASLSLGGWSAQQSGWRLLAASALKDGARLRNTEEGSEGAFRGRLTCDAPVTAPSGVMCGFYSASIRGGAGEPLFAEHAASERLGIDLSEYGTGTRVLEVASGNRWLRSERAPMRRCNLQGRNVEPFVPAEGHEDGAGEVYTFERVGRVGDTCFAVGRVTWEESRPVLHGLAGGSVVLVTESEREKARTRLRTHGALLLVLAVASTVAAAWLLAALPAQPWA